MSKGKCCKKTKEWNKLHQRILSPEYKKLKKRYPKTFGSYRRIWRAKNTEYRNAERKRYYDRHDYSDGYRNWESWDIELLFTFKNGDVALAKSLRRSVLAIQVKRAVVKKLKKGR